MSSNSQLRVCNICAQFKRKLWRYADFDKMGNQSQTVSFYLIMKALRTVLSCKLEQIDIWMNFKP